MIYSCLLNVQLQLFHSYSGRRSCHNIQTEYCPTDNLVLANRLNLKKEILKNDTSIFIPRSE